MILDKEWRTAKPKKFSKRKSPSSHQRPGSRKSASRMSHKKSPTGGKKRKSIAVKAGKKKKGSKSGKTRKARRLAHHPSQQPKSRRSSKPAIQRQNFFLKLISVKGKGPKKT